MQAIKTIEMVNSDGLRTASMFHGQVFLVGNRYSHHATHSGYEGFQRYIGTSLKPLVKFRFLKFKTFPRLGWHIDSVIGKVVRRRFYSLGLLLNEVGAVCHMLSHRKSIYHVLYGDTDVWLLGRASRIAGTQVIATFHEGPEGLEYIRINQRITRTLDAVLLVAESQRPYFQQLLPSERIFVVRHGVDTEFFRPAAQRTDEPVCITVGGHLRDFGTLTRAIDLIHQKNPRVRFIAIGTSHGHEGQPFDNSRVEFFHGIGDRELLALYQKSRVAVFCFKQATANNSLLEAMACGLPVVATDIGGVREYLGHEAGILCPPHDPETIANGVLQVLQAPSCALRMSSAGRDRALRFNYRFMAEQLADVYARIAAMSHEEL